MRLEDEDVKVKTSLSKMKNNQIGATTEVTMEQT